jgi:hypothetical protein
MLLPCPFTVVVGGSVSHVPFGKDPKSPSKVDVGVQCTLIVEGGFNSETSDDASSTGPLNGSSLIQATVLESHVHPSKLPEDDSHSSFDDSLQSTRTLPETNPESTQLSQDTTQISAPVDLSNNVHVNVEFPAPEEFETEASIESSKCNDNQTKTQQQIVDAPVSKMQKPLSRKAKRKEKAKKIAAAFGSETSNRCDKSILDDEENETEYSQKECSMATTADSHFGRLPDTAVGLGMGAKGWMGCTKNSPGPIKGSDDDSVFSSWQRRFGSEGAHSTESLGGLKQLHATINEDNGRPHTAAPTSKIHMRPPTTGRSLGPGSIE